MARVTSGPSSPEPGSGRLAQSRISLGSSLKFGGDKTTTALWTTTLLLVGFGLIMVLSASSITSYLSDKGFLGGFKSQLLYAAIGVPNMVFAASRPLDFWKKWAWVLFGAGLFLQALVFTPLGVEVWGNRNWIQLGPFNGQPSEALKLALIVWIGVVLLKKEPLLGQMKHELIPVVFPGALLALGLVLLGKDLGTAMVMAAVVFGAMYFGGVRLKTLGVMLLGALLSLVLFVVTSENRMSRLFGHASGNEDYSGLGWQPQHGLWAIADGGLFGVGLGNSKAKWSWLPAADNDYIFAIIGEELGFVGAFGVVLLYVVLAVVMLRVIGRARDRFGRAVVGGILIWVVGQAFINIGVVIGIFPVLGVPLPLVSSGGTALIVGLAAMGVVISVAKDNAAYAKELSEGAFVGR
ncbi:putative lipid II flippase FtsW [Leucobacter sp. 1207-22]|uniref:putative lipid II flippase FtsW n=1 Tax=Leucobacter sp. 1207-22 TaxID=2604456 RepID=UPI0040643A75